MRLIACLLTLHAVQATKRVTMPWPNGTLELRVEVFNVHLRPAHPAGRREALVLDRDALHRACAGQTRRAATISVRPTTNAVNISARRREVPAGAPVNSFQMNTPQKAATSVAPWPSP